MRALLAVASFLAVMALAFWAYRENYRTQAALREMTSLQTEIATLREGLRVQRAEWAYLNRPDRLQELTALNFDRLGLLPLQPEQFGQTDRIAFPAPDLPPITDAIDMIGGLPVIPPAASDPEEMIP